MIKRKTKAKAVKGRKPLRKTGRRVLKSTVRRGKSRMGRRVLKKPAALPAGNYNQSYDAGFDAAYNEGFNAGYAEGMETGHQEAYKGD
ncbi:hypothetical protein [Paenibacillus mendelii]|uniref:Flagellar assembly protein H n=1 Tax=Paenibacillus mendelii TaxID=206163 RepID=A0ABV6J931_9BACL|nr:hypothetical protein [Paenibacillus mendelii]MCQ6559728.1 hypothetical protein [Paenibacillus mendelii]